MGPATLAAVRLAVSTMSVVDLSSSWWSKALRRMRIFVGSVIRLLQNLGDDAGADGFAAFADGEAHLLFESDGRVEGDDHLDVVTGHDHLDALGQLDGAGDVGRSHVELGAVVGEKRRVPSAFFLLQHVDLAVELLVRRDGPRLGENLTALDLLFLDASQEAPHVVARLTLVEQLAEHL